MNHTAKLTEKVIQGRQRIAVSKVLKVPLTGKQILAKVKKKVPSLTYQDLRHLLRKFEKENIVVCLNPQDNRSRFYILQSAVNTSRFSSDEIALLAQLRRGTTRLQVLKEIARDHRSDLYPLTTPQIRKNLLKQWSFSVDAGNMFEVIGFLQKHRLIKIDCYTKKRNLKIWGITEKGKSILEKFHLQEQGSK